MPRRWRTVAAIEDVAMSSARMLEGWAEAPDYAWAIVGTKEGKYLWLFARQAHPSAAEKAAIVARAEALGYDTSKLIYPQ